MRPLLEPGEGERREPGDLLGPLQRGDHHVGLGTALALAGQAGDEAGFMRPLAADRLAAEQHRPGQRAARDQRQPGHGPLVGHQPETASGDAEGGAGCGDAEVAGEGELDAGAQRRAVDGSHRGHRGRVQPLEQFVEAFDEPLVLDRREVGARAEVASGAGDDDHTGRAGDGGVERVDQRVEGPAVERVATLGPVDRDELDVVVRLAVDHRPRPTGARYCATIRAR